jgi:hypothetical protein
MENGKRNTKKDQDLSAKLRKLRDEATKDYDGTTTPKNLGEIFKLLDIVANSTKMNGVEIKGNSDLEAIKSQQVQQLEDILEDVIKSTYGAHVNYVREYKHLYLK